MNDHDQRRPSAPPPPTSAPAPDETLPARRPAWAMEALPSPHDYRDSEQYVAGRLSTLPPFAHYHPAEALPYARHALEALGEWGTLQTAARAQHAGEDPAVDLADAEARYTAADLAYLTARRELDRAEKAHAEAEDALAAAQTAADDAVLDLIPPTRDAAEALAALRLDQADAQPTGVDPYAGSVATYTGDAAEALDELRRADEAEPLGEATRTFVDPRDLGDADREGS